MTYSGREYGVCLFFSIHTDDNNYPFTAVSVKHWCSDPPLVCLSRRACCQSDSTGATPTRPAYVSALLSEGQYTC